MRTAAEEANADLLVIGRSVENELVGCLRALPDHPAFAVPVVSV